MTCFHLENLRFSRVLRTRDRLVRSGQHIIHSLLKPASRQGDDHRRLVDPPLRDRVAVDDEDGYPQAILPLEVAVAANLHDPRVGGMVREEILDRFAEVAAAAGVENDVHIRAGCRGLGTATGASRHASPTELPTLAEAIRHASPCLLR